jgi:hypothetical protein
LPNGIRTLTESGRSAGRERNQGPRREHGPAPKRR